MATIPKTAEAMQAAKGVFGKFTGVFTSARQMLGDFVELVAFEARRAGLSLVWMIMLGVVAAMLLVTTWLALMTALAFWLVSLGVTLAGAIAIVAVTNLLMAVAIGFVCFLLSRNLLFPATRRQLKPESPPSDVV